MRHRGRELAYASPPAQIPACALTHGAPASDDDEAWQLARLRVLKNHSCEPEKLRLRSAPNSVSFTAWLAVPSGRFRRPWGFPDDIRTTRYSRWASGTRCKADPSGFLCAAFVSSQPHVTRFPASECGTCFGLPDSPRLWPLAPSAPQAVTACCSQVSQLLWPHLTSSDRTSGLVIPP